MFGNPDVWFYDNVSLKVTEGVKGVLMLIG
jgi:hypothetical protein